MSTALTARIIDEYATAARALPSSGTAADRRRAALAVLTAQGLPTSRDENWKYANLRPLERLRFVPAVSSGAATRLSVSAAELPPALPACARYVFVDGLFAPALSAPAASGNASVTPLASVEHTTAASTPQDSVDERFLALNEAFATDGAAIQVSADRS